MESKSSYDNGPNETHDFIKANPNYFARALVAEFFKQGEAILEACKINGAAANYPYNKGEYNSQSIHNTWKWDMEKVYKCLNINYNKNKDFASSKEFQQAWKIYGEERNAFTVRGFLTKIRNYIGDFFTALLNSETYDKIVNKVKDQRVNFGDVGTPPVILSSMLGQEDLLSTSARVDSNGEVNLQYNNIPETNPVVSRLILQAPLDGPLPQEFAASPRNGYDSDDESVASLEQELHDHREAAGLNGPTSNTQFPSTDEQTLESPR